MDVIDREQALKALEEISYALWEIDIPSPTVPEYIEHHEGVQAVMEVADRWARKIQASPSARKRGKWINSYDLQGNHYKRCSECGAYIDATFFANDYSVNFCPKCGAEMEVK